MSIKIKGFWQLTRPWAATQEPPLSFAAPINPCALHLLADFDGDGMVDLLGSSENIDPFLKFDDYYGLALWRLDASGGWTRHSLLDWKVFPSEATASDLNDDGVLDVAMIAGNSPIGPALMVWLGQRNGAPVLEGYYPLPSAGNQVFASDVNGDGDTDLVVLGTSPASDRGGVFVFINQGTPATAVASETTTTPTAFALGANYPNPFNPATTIPLAVPAGAKNVDLNHLQRPRTAAAPSVEWSAACWRAPANLGWPRRAGSPRRHWGLCISGASGRADARPQNGQNRISEPSKLNNAIHYALLIGLLCSATSARAVDSLDVGQDGRLGRWDSIVEEVKFLGVASDSIWMWPVETGENLSLRLAERGGMAVGLVANPNGILPVPIGTLLYDGNSATAFDPDQFAAIDRNTPVEIDLGATFRVNRIRLFPRLDRQNRRRFLQVFRLLTKAERQAEYDPAISVLASVPNVEPVVERRIDSRDVRYVRIEPSTEREWELAEVEIYAAGDAPVGTYVSRPVRTRYPNIVWGKVRYEGGSIENAPASVQTRTGSDRDPEHYFRIDLQAEDGLQAGEQRGLPSIARRGKGADQTQSAVE